MTMNFQECLKDLENRSLFPLRAPSLDRMYVALRRLSLDEPTLKKKLNGHLERVILIAGTNGKGTTAATLEALLLSAGQTTGFYSSPHLVRYNERFRLSGEEISDTEWAEIYRDVLKQTRDLNLSHFEMLTLTAAIFFFTHLPVWFLFEVGLGGTWDATNAIPHNTCIITSLGFDHTQLLGKTLTDIAKNKFGIIPQRNPQEGAKVIHHPFPQELCPLQEETQRETNSTWVAAPTYPFHIQKKSYDSIEYIIETSEGQQPLSLLGERAVENTSLALTAFEQLGFSIKKALPALSNVQWQGRMEKQETPQGPLFLSGDHNPQGIQSLIEILKHFDFERLHLLVGVGREKDLNEILGPLFTELPSHIYLTTTPFQTRALSDYGPWLNKAQESSSDPIPLLKKILTQRKPKEGVLVTGSLYLVGQVKSWLER